MLSSGMIFNSVVMVSHVKHDIDELFNSSEVAHSVGGHKMQTYKNQIIKGAITASCTVRAKIEIKCDFKEGLRSKMMILDIEVFSCNQQLYSLHYFSIFFACCTCPSLAKAMVHSRLNPKKVVEYKCFERILPIFSFY